MVLYLHSSLRVLSLPTGTKKFFCLEAIQVLGSPAVFLFFILSGTTLLTYRSRMNTRTFFNHRFRKIVPPFLGWSVGWYIASHYVHMPFSPFRKSLSLIDFVNSFATNNINVIFWFFYAIIGLYLVTPVLSAMIDKHKDYLFFIMILSFVTNSLIPAYMNIAHIQANYSFVQFPLITTSFVGYFIFGALFKQNYFSHKYQNWLLLLGLLSLIISLMAVVNPRLLHLLSGYNWSGYSAPLTFLYSLGLYTFLFRTSQILKPSERAKKILKALSGCTLGIYIIHPLLYMAFTKLTGIVDGSSLYVLVFPIGAYLIGIPSIYVLQKVPIIRTLFP